MNWVELERAAVVVLPRADACVRRGGIVGSVGAVDVGSGLVADAGAGGVDRGGAGDEPEVAFGRVSPVGVGFDSVQLLPGRRLERRERPVSDRLPDQKVRAA